MSKSGSPDKQKPALNSLVEHFRKVDSILIPSLIDYCGLSYYYCDTADPQKKRLFLPICKEYFNRWKLYIERKSDKNREDFERIVEYDTRYRKIFVDKWRIQTKELRTCRLRYLFQRWKGKCAFQLIQLHQVQMKAISMVKYWKFIALSHKVSTLCNKLNKRIYFKIWRSESRLEMKLQRIEKRTARTSKKRFFKLWKIRKVQHQRMINGKNIEDKRNNKLINCAFDDWKCAYLEKTSEFNQQKHEVFIQRDKFDIWKKHLEKRNQENQHVEVLIEGRNKKIIKKLMKRWKNNYNKSRKRRQKRNDKMWIMTTIRVMQFSSVKKVRELFLEDKIFNMLHQQVKIKNNEIMQMKFDKWHKITRDSVTFKKTQQSKNRIILETSMMRWQDKLVEIDDQRLIKQVQNKIEPIIIQFIYKYWKTRFIARQKDRIKRATKFCRRNVLYPPFYRWHHYTDFLSIRARTHHNEKLLQRAFGVLFNNIDVSNTEKQKHMQMVRCLILMRSSFERMKNLISERVLEEESNSLIDIFNREQPPKFITKIKYF